MTSTDDRVWGIRYLSDPSRNTTICGTFQDAMNFAYGEAERPIEICTSDTLGNLVVARTLFT